MNTNEQIVSDLAEAWRTLNPELLIQHLAPDHDAYVDYIRGKFSTIKKSGSRLTIHEVPRRSAIAIVQDGKAPAFYIIEIKDGKIVKGDLTAFL